jgi:hypothetical protein
MSRRVPWSFLLLTAGLAGFSSAGEAIITLILRRVPFKDYSILADDTSKASSSPTSAPASSKSRQIFAPTDYGFDANSALLLSLLNNRELNGELQFTLSDNLLLVSTVSSW